MKKHLLLLVLSISSFSIANAQITITSANMPASNDTIRYSTANPNSFDVNLTGPNYFWNYDSIVPITQGRYDYKAALQTPYAFFFLGLNKYGLKVQDTIGFGAFTFTDVWTYFKKTTSFFNAEGTGFTYSGLPIATYYTDEDEIYQFPLNYLDRDSSTFAYSASLGTGISYTQKGYRINEVDGWGSIKTTYDSVPCLRLVSTTYSTDSINFNGFGFSFPNIQRSYKWMVTTEKIPFLEVSGTYQGNNFNATQARYRDTWQDVIGVKENTNANLTKVYPNPASNEVMFHIKKKDVAQLSVYDLQGKLVETKKVETDKVKLLTSAYANGMYIYKLSNASKQVLEDGKFLIVK